MFEVTAVAFTLTSQQPRAQFREHTFEFDFTNCIFTRCYRVSCARARPRQTLSPSLYLLSSLCERRASQVQWTSNTIGIPYNKNNPRVQNTYKLIGNTLNRHRVKCVTIPDEFQCPHIKCNCSALVYWNRI